MMSWKIVLLHQRREEEWDLRKILTGEFMALYASSKSKRTWTREDFFKISSDTQLTKEIDPDLFGKVARRLGSTIKRKDSGDK